MSRFPSLQSAAMFLFAAAIAAPAARADVLPEPRPIPALPPPPRGTTAPDLPRPALPPAPSFRAPAPALAQGASGVQVAVLPRRELPLVSITAAVRAGSALDPAGKGGLAAAVAMMLQDGGAGSRSATALAQAIEALGDELRVEVDPDGVRLQLTVLSRSLEPALALLADVIARPRFDAAEWPRARARRLGEIASHRDQPRRLADQLFARAVFGDHPYGAPVLGTPSSVDKLTAGDLRGFHALRYGPRTTTIVLAGDVDPARAGALVDAAFAGWRSEAQPPARPAEAPAGTGTRLILVDRPGAPQSEVRVGRC